jgi:sugar O-acyltransferase (sialic acid O-acetyltransferase NeuD family)
MTARNDTPKSSCVVLGGGGHAKVVLDCLFEEGKTVPYGILDSDQQLWGSRVLGVLILGGDEKLPELIEHNVRKFVIGVGNSIGSDIRHRLFEMAIENGLEPTTVKHPTAVCSTNSTIGAGCQFLPLSVVNAGSLIGSNVLINSGAIVEHDCEIGDHVHICPGARLSGNVQVSHSAHIGVGATILQGIKIGESAVVGAGSVVTKDVPPGETVLGVPADRFIKMRDTEGEAGFSDTAGKHPVGRQ